MNIIYKFITTVITLIAMGINPWIGCKKSSYPNMYRLWWRKSCIFQNQLYIYFMLKTKKKWKKGEQEKPAWVLYTRITQQNQFIHITANVSPFKIDAKSLLPGFFILRFGCFSLSNFWFVDAVFIRRHLDFKTGYSVWTANDLLCMGVCLCCFVAIFFRCNYFLFL